MTKENWEEFSNKVHQVLTPILEDEIILDTKSLNRYWNIWSSNIIRTANQLIPSTHTAPKPFFALSLKVSKLYSILKHINKCYYILTSSSPLLSIEYLNSILNKHLSKATSLAEISNLTLNQ